VLRLLGKGDAPWSRFHTLKLTISSRKGSHRQLFIGNSSVSASLKQASWQENHMIEQEHIGGQKLGEWISENLATWLMRSGVLAVSLALILSLYEVVT
jgi:hypothetical protein